MTYRKGVPSAAYIGGGLRAEIREIKSSQIVYPFRCYILPPVVVSRLGSTLCIFRSNILVSRIMFGCPLGLSFDNLDLLVGQVLTLPIDLYLYLYLRTV